MEDTIVLYPAPGMGHVVSMVELGKLILRHHKHKFSTINVILTTGILDSPSLSSYIQYISTSIPSISFIRLPLIPTTSKTCSFVAKIFDFIRRNAPNVQNALQEISLAHKIRAFIIDFFCTSALPIARELDIPTYYYFTSGAAVLGLFLYFPSFHNKQIHPIESLKDLPDKFLDVPGIPPLPAPHVPHPLLDRFDPAYDDMIYFCTHLPKSDGIIVNTFHDLELNAIKTIGDGACTPTDSTPPMYHVGPLISDPYEGGRVEGNGNKEQKDGCLSWLDAQPSQSVVFLCFGSMGTFSTKQLKEIANGLERSEQRFLWVVKNPPPDEKGKQVDPAMAANDIDLSILLPEGFLERTIAKGMVVKSWAPQAEILSHDSVGGFVTHCGWNSVLEAVVAGVPMVAWPLYAEQYVNKAILVENMKMAIPVDERKEDGLVIGAELEKRLRELMQSEHGKELKERSRKMREMAVSAMGESGSSTNALRKLVDVW